MMARAYLSLGSNVGDRFANLHAAIDALARIGRVVKASSFYETEPVEFTAQEWFINCVVELETPLAPRALLDALLGIEQSMGRRRGLPKGPRNIDLDILFYEDRVIEEPGLRIPHPAMHRRRFVLAPLAEIAPDAIHPVFMRSSRDLLLGLAEGQDAVRRLPGRAGSPAKSHKR